MKFDVSRSGELNSTLRPIREDQPMRRGAADAIWRFMFMGKEVTDAQPEGQAGFVRASEIF
ncbi:hypothetical protein AB838_06145 [Rhodobacteraceae bacterium (ex Bugula neritina AB1)]|nr:hypothetical protein AB838_06145 [Rhodobacteraceae bacterium (ex Bugula neritina AB1)]